MQNTFERKKRAYFALLGFRMRKALYLHKASGLWKKEKGKRGKWGGVSEHCLVEVARAEVLADWLGLPHDVKSDLLTAVALHDFNKKQEILGIKEATSRGVSPADELYRIEKEKVLKLRKGGFSEQVIRYVGATGSLPDALLEVRRVLDRETFYYDDTAFLVQHYVDAYTRDSSWVEPAQNGENDLDRRIKRNRDRYRDVERAIIESRFPNEPLFAGKGLSGTMGEFGHEIERRFASMIFRATGRRIEPIRLPEVIDEEIKRRIAAP